MIALLILMLIVFLGSKLFLLIFGLTIGGFVSTKNKKEK